LNDGQGQPVFSALPPDVAHLAAQIAAPGELDFDVNRAVWSSLRHSLTQLISSSFEVFQSQHTLALSPLDGNRIPLTDLFEYTTVFQRATKQVKSCVSPIGDAQIVPFAWTHLL
jgi:hypothetical protein